MALLTPNAIYTMNGVTVNEKIIPDGTRWKDSTKAKKAGFDPNSLYKKQAKLCGTGKPTSISVHNTNDLKNVHDDAEQYTRATYNENMNSSRVTFYVDDTGAWQNLKAGTGLCPNDPLNSAEVGWHAGDGSSAKGGNMTSLSFEVIMGQDTAADAKAKDNSARMIAWLLKFYGLTLNDVVTHTYWVNKSAGKYFADVDKQCTNRILGKKWCPTYIFGSTNATTAYNNWKAYKALIKKYLDELNGSTTVEPTPAPVVTPTKKSLDEIAQEVYKGKWGNGETRKANLRAAGYTDAEISSIQSKVNDIVNGNKKSTAPAKKSLDEIAQEVWDGKWGNGETRKTNLKNAGYTTAEINTIQQKVNDIANKKTTATPVTPAKKDLDAIAQDVVNGAWGNGETRKNKLKAAGYTDAEISTIQQKVNALLNKSTSTSSKKSINTIANEVIQGKWGNGTTRKNKLKAAGYTTAEINAIQKRVNELLI